MSAPMSPLPIDYTRAVITHAWKRLERICEAHHTLSARLEECVTDELRREREFRKGKRTPAYRVSAEYAARLFVMQHVYETPMQAVKPDVFTSRLQILACYGLGRYMHETKRTGSKAPSCLAEWMDYIYSPHGYRGEVLVAGNLAHAPGELAEKLRASRARYQEPNDVPIVVALDYPRDVAGMVL